jgi:hypothetical protein
VPDVSKTAIGVNAGAAVVVGVEPASKLPPSKPRYFRLFHAAEPFPTLIFDVLVSSAISPRASVGFELSHWLDVPRRIWMLVSFGIFLFYVLKDHIFYIVWRHYYIRYPQTKG